MVLFLSAVWLLAVDSTGRLIGKRWAESDSVDSADWLSRLALADPRMALRAGSLCMATATDQQICRIYFERALNGNHRLAEAEMALILIAEKRKDVVEATRMLQRLKENDRSFAARWLEWNFHLRNGPTEAFRDRAGEILRTAPAGFRGDFPLLPLTGMRDDDIIEAMVDAGATGRALDYAANCGVDGDSKSGDLLVNLLGRVDRIAASDAALRFIAERLESRRGFQLAARVWTEAIRRGLVSDNRRSPDDDPMLNPNPRLRMPFVPRSFDWSAVVNRWASVSNGGGEGVRIEVAAGAPKGLPLLSKLVLLPEGTTSVRVLMRAGRPEHSNPIEEGFGRRIVWQIYDALSDRVIVESASEGRPSGSGYRAFDLPLHGISNSGAVFVNLAVGSSGDVPSESWALTVSDIEFEILQ